VYSTKGTDNIPRFGEEASERARVWNVYRDRVKDIDEDMLEGWDETLNVLLLFVRH